ncbi:hypothetical protein OE88DRAFT_1652571 [Heliocybe sulcata]|uniref:COP9 signalosome complex subunit 4 n=1 Tax=Heliocybe sulcata TaxID=5364 RepID=A0A5C3NIT4_9AGAM|nr:hypothetical protein OE88DRAFT_1652571 [Heliocybe sulcata]
MDQTLAQYASLGQKDKAPAYLSLLQETLSHPDQSRLAADIHTIVDHVVNNDSVGPVVGRQVLADLAKALGAAAIKDSAIRRQVVEDTLAVVQPRLVSYEEQVNVLRFQLADLLEAEEEWSDAARVLMGISLESGQRSVSDEEKLRVYIRIVRLLLEDEDSTQADSYYNRAALLAHTTTDKETQLAFKLCQARIMDYNRRFLEAAQRYNELSWVADIDEEERKQMLSAAVTCAVLTPAGPNRSRVLASLCRDERTADLPTYNILSKMFLDRILRPAEIHEFEGTLKTHQLAKINMSSNDRLASIADDDDDDEGASISKRKGPSTVLDRAVLEHNLLASSRIYNNITFRGLGALLDLTPGAAETMARKMIEQGRLKGFIDQVDRLIWFETGNEDEEAQNKAGGLGDVEQETEDTGAAFTKRWDMQIRMTAAEVESIVQHLSNKSLLGAVTA